MHGGREDWKTGRLEDWKLALTYNSHILPSSRLPGKKEYLCYHKSPFNNPRPHRDARRLQDEGERIGVVNFD